MDKLTPVQLSLGVSLRDDATFANFYVGSGNELTVHMLGQFCADQGDRNLLIWGGHGSGLTHLLQACCHDAHQHHLDIQYLPLGDLVSFSPDDVFESLDATRLVCLDGLDAICGHRAWEKALFHLFNRLRDHGHRLLMASHVSPPLLPLLLPDLKSRILGSVVYHVRNLDDGEKAAALQMRAKRRGMDLADDVAKYIMARASRNTADLFELLNHLDDVSLQQQRKLTVPFVKDVLNQGAAPL